MSAPTADLVLAYAAAERAGRELAELTERLARLVHVDAAGGNVPGLTGLDVDTVRDAIAVLPVARSCAATLRHELGVAVGELVTR